MTWQNLCVVEKNNNVLFRFEKQSSDVFDLNSDSVKKKSFFGAIPVFLTKSEFKVPISGRFGLEETYLMEHTFLRLWGDFIFIVKM